MEVEQVAQTKIAIRGSQTKGIGPQRYTLYQIQGKDLSGPISIFRRYSQFDELRNLLVTRWPGIIVPTLPPKKTTGSLQQQLVEHRKQALSSFLRRLAKKPALWFSEQCQIFLRNKEERCLTVLLPQQHFTKIDKFGKQFPQLQGLQVTKSMREKLAVFLTDVKAMEPDLIHLLKKAQILQAKRKEYFTNQIAVLQAFGLYQSSVLKEYLNSQSPPLLFTGDQNQLSHAVEGYSMTVQNDSPQFNLLSGLLHKQLREVQAALQAIQVKNSLITKSNELKAKFKALQSENQRIQAGNVSITSKIKNNTKEQQLAANQAQIKLVADQLNQVSFLCQAAVALLAVSQIDSFLAERRTSYIEALRIYFQWQKIVAQRQIILWQCIYNATLS